MHPFTNLMLELIDKIPFLTFPQILQQSREIMGLIQYRVAKHLNFELPRLRNLENGNFSTMPHKSEIEALARFYGVPEKELLYKAEIHVNSKKKEKMRIKDDKNKVYSMQTVQVAD